MSDDEIRLKLKLQDEAGAAVHTLGEGLEHAGHEATHLASELAQVAKQALATAAGFQLSASIDGIKEFGKEIFDAARASDAETKAIAGILAVNDQTGKSWEDLSKDAKGYREQLVDVGIETGQLNSEVQEAFQAVAARSGQSADKVTELVEIMAMAGRGVKGGIGALSEGFAMIEVGAIRARNPVVQLIAQSHLLKGTAKEVAQELQKMTPEEALKLGEAAIGRMADKMKNVKPTFGEAMNSLKGMREELLETLGAPLVGALKKPLLDLSAFLKNNRTAMEEYAKAAGTKIGEWVTDAAGLMRDGFHYLQDHADEIKDALKEGWGYAKTVLDLVIAHKDLFKLGLEAYAVSKVGGGALAAAGPGLGIAKAAVAGGAPALGVAGGGAAAGALALGSFVAAAGAVYLAADQWFKLAGTLGTEEDANKKYAASLRAMSEAGDIEGVKKHTDAMVASHEEYGRSLQAMGPFSQMFHMITDDLLNMGDTLGMARDDFSEFVQDLKAEAEEEAGSRDIVASMVDDDPLKESTEQIVNAYNFAQAQHSAAATQFAADYILRSGLTEDAIKKAGLDLAGGFEEFDALFGNAAQGTLDKLKLFHTGLPGGDMGKVSPAHVSVGGGNTINIKQDFREENPDRIALIMRRDVIKAAEGRRQSRFGTPFGL